MTRPSHSRRCLPRLETLEDRVTPAFTDGLGGGLPGGGGSSPAVLAVLSPAAPLTVNADSHTISGTAPANSLVRVYRDANHDNAISGDAVAGSSQLSNGATSFSIEIPLTQNAVNNFLVTAESGGVESVRLLVFPITDRGGNFSSGVVVSPQSGDGRVVIADSSGMLSELTPYEGYLGKLAVARGDTNGNFASDLITVARNSAHVKVFDGEGRVELHSFLAFPGFNGEVSVTTGDFNADGKADVVVGASDGVRGHVKIYSGIDGRELISAFALDDAPVGILVAAGDRSGDGVSELIVTAVGKPRISVLRPVNGAFIQAEAQIAPFQDYLGGLSIAATDVNGDGRADLVVGAAGPGAPPHVVVLLTGPGQNLSFNAFDPAFRGGVSVGTDGAGNVIVAAGVGSHVKTFGHANLQELDSFFALTPDFTGGIAVS